ncbi:MAG: leucine-rich repeat domain-containing protein [Lepagella sp.]
MRKFKLFSLLAMLICMGVNAKTYTEGIFLFTTLDDSTCKVEQADPSTSISEKSIDIPAVVQIDGKAYGVVEIAPNGFNSSKANSTVTSIIIPEGIKTIGEYAFANFSQVKNLEIPNSVTTLSANSFYNLGGLQNVTIGSGITDIPDLCFQRSGSINNVYMRPTVPPTLATKSAFLNFFGP